MRLDNNQQAFFALMRAGLWEQNVRLAQYDKIDFSIVYQLAEEQSVLGLVAAGLEHVTDINIPQQWALQFAGQAIQIEQRNKAMNAFLAQLIKKLRDEDIYTLLVKGQGVALCYERPLWRACGDVDLYLSIDNYEKAKSLLLPLAQYVEDEDKEMLHLGMTINGWMVELHGAMHSKFSRRINRVADEVHRDLFYNGNVRSWNDNGIQVFLPGINNDVIIIFNHFINHFYGEGVGFRQICDWCRLMRKYYSQIDKVLLEKRLKTMGLMPEWKAFAALAVDTLGIPDEAMLLYDNKSRWQKKGCRIVELILESGNFGHAVDKSYKYKYSTLRRAFAAFNYHTAVALKRFFIFPYYSFFGWKNLIHLGVISNFKKLKNGAQG